MKQKWKDIRYHCHHYLIRRSELSKFPFYPLITYLYTCATECRFKHREKCLDIVFRRKLDEAEMNRYKIWLSSLFNKALITFKTPFLYKITYQYTYTTEYRFKHWEICSEIIFRGKFNEAENEQIWVTIVIIIW